MNVKVVNPGAVVLDQIQEHYQKLLAMVVWKLAPGGVTLSLADIERFAHATEAGDAVLLTHGHFDSIEFKIVDAASAQRLADHDAKQRGRA